MPPGVCGFPGCQVRQGACTLANTGLLHLNLNADGRIGHQALSLKAICTPAVLRVNAAALLCLPHLGAA